MHCNMICPIIGVQTGSNVYIKVETNNLHNYRSIMVNLLMAKLFGCMMESNVSAWVKKMVRELIDKLGFENTMAPFAKTK